MKKLIILFSLLLMITSSCKKEIKIELKDTYVRLVVDGLLTNEAKRHTIKLSLTSNYFSSIDEEKKAEGAVVSLNDGTNTIILTETSAGIYQTDSTYKGEIGKTYTLNIEYDKEEYSAVSIMKPVAPIDSIGFGIYENYDHDPTAPEQSSLFMYAQEPVTTGDYYLWNYYINGVLKSDTITDVAFASDEMVNGNYVSDNFPIYGFKANPTDSITLEMRSITKEYYDFLLGIMYESMMGSSPFSGPPSNVKGNVKNITNKEKVVMGFFITSAVSKKTKMFE